MDDSVLQEFFIDDSAAFVDGLAAWVGGLAALVDGSAAFFNWFRREKND